MADRTYIAIDLKSFYASVECVERGLDPMTTNLVVADVSRTEKTICLAVSPSLKAYGIPGRARLFEVIQKVRDVNARRQQSAPNHTLTGACSDAKALQASPTLAVDYVTAPPQMARYIEISSQIYHIYLKYIAPEDIHVYSIDEVFMDVTHYLKTYGLTARELAMRMILDVLNTTGITATAGIGSNLYLCKIAMDIEAKHIPPDEHGVRIAELDELHYRRALWGHRPLTDFWRVGRGYARKLEAHGLYTMGDVARCSMENEELLYKLFGINAELLIDHAWGWEPCTIADIKAYRPASSGCSSGQVLHCPYPAEKARLIVREMADTLGLDLLERGLVTDQVALAVGYDMESLDNPTLRAAYQGELATDFYGRSVPKPAVGTAHLPRFTASSRQLIDAFSRLFDEIVDIRLLVRRLTLTANHLTEEAHAPMKAPVQQLDLFTDYAALAAEEEAQNAELAREKQVQQVLLNLKKRYGKNAVLKGMNLEEGATARERNRQIGGHKA